MELTDIEAPNRYTILFEDRGGAAGFGKDDAHVRPEPQDDEATTLTRRANAPIGPRLIDGAARRIAAEFFKRFGEQSGSGENAAREADEVAIEPTSAGAAAAAGDYAAVEASGGATKERKRSWTAWISKS